MGKFSLNNFLYSDVLLDCSLIHILLNLKAILLIARSGASKLLADVIHLLSRFDLIYGLKSNVSYFLSIK